MKKSYVFAIIVAIYVTIVSIGCSMQKNGCPAAHSNGIMRGKFRA